MRSLILLAATCAAFAASAQPAGRGAEPATGDDARFARYVERLFDRFWQLNPEWAIANGYYKYADRLVVPDAVSRAARLKLDETAGGPAPDRRRSSRRERRADWELLATSSSPTLVRHGAARLAVEPLGYNVADRFALRSILEYAPLEKRLRDILARLENVPAYYAAAARTSSTRRASTPSSRSSRTAARSTCSASSSKTAGSKLTSAERRRSSSGSRRREPRSGLRGVAHPI